MRKLLSALFFLALSFRILPYPLETNLIHGCEGKWNCKFREEVFLLEQDYETNFLIEYSYNCMGHPLELGIEVENKDKENTWYAFRGKDREKVILSGFGPVKSKNFNLRRLKGAYLNDCSIVVHKVDIEGPTDNAKLSLDSQIKSLEERLSELDTLIQSLEYFINYKAAFLFMQDLASMFHSELTSEQMKSFRDEGERIVLMIPSIIQKLATKNLSETQDIISSLVRMMSALNDMKGMGNWVKEDGSPKKIEDFLSQKDKEILEKLSKDSLSVKNAKEKLEDALKEKVELEARAVHLNKTRKDWINHDEL